MMKRYLQILLLLILASSPSYAQVYGNEWINFSQKYFAFNVHTTGIQRIDQAALAAASVPTSTFTSENIQIFGREREVPILVVDGNDNSFDPGDYILFYAEKNDGWIDSLVYLDPEHIANPGKSLYNDTIQYFFTWNSQTGNERFTVDTDTGFGNYGAPANYVLKELTPTCATTTMAYSEGYRYDKASGSFYAPGEGWGCGGVNLDQYNVTLLTYSPYTGMDAPPATVDISVTSNSNAEVSPDHHLHMDIGASNYQLIDTVFEAYGLIKYTSTLPVGFINSVSTNLRMQSVDNLGAAADRMNLNYWKIRYPRLPDTYGQGLDVFHVENNPNSTKTQLDLVGVPGTNIIVFSLGSANYALTPVLNGAAQQMLIPNNASGPTTKVVVSNLSETISITQFEAVNGSGQFTDFSALSTEEALLMVYHPLLQQATANYANYRALSAGGSHNVVLANIRELYQQYGGGVEKHVLAIRRFALEAYNNATQKPVGLFLIGKGISEAGEAGTRLSASSFATSLIPSFGYPSSDIAITAGLNGTFWDPLIPTGRISVATNQQLQEYLEKVMEYEAVQVQNDPSNYSIASKDWQKQALHFVGGSDAGQQDTFRNYMDELKGIYEDTTLAGNVTSYYKTSSDPLDPTVVAGVTEKISNGVSLMTFFGHAAVSNNGFEINIDEPTNWENHGKYPVVIGNSCYNGDIFAPEQLSTSEKFVNLPEEGAIAFLSSVFVGYDSYLYQYSRRLYQNFSYRNYGAPLGEQMRQTIQYLQTTWIGADLIAESTCLQMALHGDPMLRVNWHERPEIDISAQSLYFEPGTLNLTIDSIEMNLIVTNLGQMIHEPFDIVVSRNFPGTTIDSVYTISRSELLYKDTVRFKMPLQPNIGVGINQFRITADLPSFIPEQAEELTNNQITYDYFINVDGILPVYPYDFAVVPNDTVTVRASTVNPIAGIRTYLFQLDTTDLYDSPQFRQFSVTDSGGVKEVLFDQWQTSGGGSFPLICTDSTVYFWRVAVDSSILNWTEYSFQYIEGKQGWGQDHFFQFKKNDFYNIVYNRTDRLREFSPPDTHIVSIYAFENPSFPYYYFNRWAFDGNFESYGDYGTVMNNVPAVYVFVIDPVTLQPWKTRFLNENPDNNFGNGNDNPNDNCSGCHHRADKYFAFDQSSPAQLSALRNMLENVIPNGFYVGVYTNMATLYSNWDVYQPELYTTFQNLGSTLINNSQPEKPFTLFVKKGDPSTLIEKHYPDTLHVEVLTGYQTNTVTVDGEILTTDARGIERTPLIGPAMDWGTLYWRRDSLEMFTADSVRLYIEAHDLSGALQLSIDTVFTPNDSIIQLNSLVDAAQYPLLRLGMYYADDFFLTPAQVERLHILYTPVPEATIDGTQAYYLNPQQDTLQEGQLVSFAINVRNISDYDMDSLLVNYWVEDANRVKHPIPYLRQRPLLAGDTLRDTIQFSTYQYPGQNSLWMEVNPYVNGSAYQTDQPEQYHFNNLLQIPLYVEEDDVHPILDVTFDGKHILNGDIINPESQVLITLKDDNPYLIMDDISDTTSFGIYLTDPLGVQRRIPFMDGNGNIVMQWVPADAQNKKFRIIYPAMFELNGKYTLIVQGTDKTGNISGDIEYRIAFEIVRESSITYMMNYPNPFSTSTRFVFTVTGTEAPDDLVIQIMTVTGRVVREITEAEIGPISIGRNISEYAWDGTDEFGDPLANGVYLYRVKAKLNGEDIKHRETGADLHFKKEFGKMYLMR